MNQSLKRIGILTGGGDVPGLNSVIKTAANRALADGIDVLGIRRGWRGLVEVRPDDPASVEQVILPLTADRVRTVDRTGGTMLHSSRVNPVAVSARDLPPHLDAADYPQDAGGNSDLTGLVRRNLAALGIDALVVTGGDDTLGYAARLDQAGFPTVGIPKTMDNDVMGTDYCIGFSTAVTRSVDMITDLRTPAGSHERIAVIELFGRNSGATALYAGYLSGADRVLVAEVPFDLDRLGEQLAGDQDRSPSSYAILVLSEGSHAEGGGAHESGEADAYGHRKLGGVGDWVGAELKARTGRATLVQRLAYLMRSGRPDSVDRMVATNFAHLAYEGLRDGNSGIMTAIRNGLYATSPLADVMLGARKLDVARYYDAQEYRPKLPHLAGIPLFL